MTFVVFTLIIAVLAMIYKLLQGVTVFIDKIVTTINNRNKKF